MGQFLKITFDVAAYYSCLDLADTAHSLHSTEHLKGTSSRPIKMREIHTSHVKGTSFTCSLVIN